MPKQDFPESIDLTHPHDSFFRKALSNPRVATDLIKAHVPDDLVQKAQWKTLQLTNKSFVKETLRQYHSDVVYKCLLNDGREAYIYYLIEHQSTPDDMLPFRILQYNVGIMEEYLAQGNKRLPVIINLCLYAGEKSPYPYSVDIYDCFEDPILARKCMFGPLKLIDLTIIDDETFAQHGHADLLELLLKHGRKRDAITWIKKHAHIIRNLLERAYGKSGIIYILGADQENKPQEVMETITSILPEKTDEIMSAAQQLMQQGIQEGMQQGIQEGMQQGIQEGMQQGIQEGMQQGIQEGMQQGMQQGIREVAENMLRNHLPIEQIQQYTGIPQKELVFISNTIQQ